MYTALYGIFLFVMPKLDEMYRRKHGLRRFSLGELEYNDRPLVLTARYTDDEEDWGRQYDHIIYPYQTPPQTADPYTKAVRVKHKPSRLMIKLTNPLMQSLTGCDVIVRTPPRGTILSPIPTCTAQLAERGHHFRLGRTFQLPALLLPLRMLCCLLSKLSM